MQVQWRMHRSYDTADPVIPERHNATSLQADHAKRSQMPRLRQALRILAPRR